MIRSPFSYLGNKQKLLPLLLPHLQTGTKFVDVFGGSGTVCANVTHSQRVYNDLCHSLCGMLQAIVSDPQSFVAFLEQSPHSRKMFAQSGYDPRHTLYRYLFSMNKAGSIFGRVMDNPLYSSRELMYSRLMTFADAMQGVLFTQRPFEQALEEEDGPGTLFFLDPPYEGTLVNKYSYKWTTSDTIRLNKLACRVQGKVVLTCYPSEHWTLPSVHTVTYARNCGGPQMQHKGIREEAIYVKEALR